MSDELWVMSFFVICAIALRPLHIPFAVFAWKYGAVSRKGHEDLSAKNIFVLIPNPKSLILVFYLSSFVFFNPIFAKNLKNEKRQNVYNA